MGRRTHSKIDKLDPAVKATVDEMIKTGAYYREIVDYIKSHGISISVTAVGKYAKKLMSTLDALRLSQENFRAIMEETDRYPDLDMTDGIEYIDGSSVKQIKVANHRIDDLERSIHHE